MILFCLPYAGGSEIIYAKWKRYLNPLIQIEPIELRGKGKQFGDVPYTSIEELIEDVFSNIKCKIENNSYAIYGHSMGGLVAYELYYKIQMEGMKLPNHIFFSGYKPPNIERGGEKISMFPDDKFMKKVIDLGGTPAEIVDDNELFKIFTPIIKADFKIIENYVYKEKSDKIRCDISVLNGNKDDITLEEILEWKCHTDNKFSIYSFEGNHFFINEKTKEIVEIINKTLI